MILKLHKTYQRNQKRGIMELIICENYNELSSKAADIVAEQVKQNPNCVLGLATGSTPIGTYQALIQKEKAGEISFENVTSFNLDEYYPISADNSQSYHYFMNENLFSHISIKKENTHILDGSCEDVAKECAQFEEMIKQAGGIDLQILGIGENGHIGFNEPDEYLQLKTHLTDLTQNTIDVNSRFFDKIEDVPTQAITMGIGTIFNARKIIILASGKNKHNIICNLLGGEISSSNPSSLLHLHENVVLICDKPAYQGA